MNPILSAIRDVRYCGLSPDGVVIPALTGELSRELGVIQYKAKNLNPWVVFLGGTGTGKSTLFNVLCGAELSLAGIERPKTFGPVAYAHETVGWKDIFPFPEILIHIHSPADASARAVVGATGRLTVIPHNREGFSHLIVVDSPDVDSVEEQNRRIAEDLYLLADVVIFVASPEKYADDISVQVLRRVLEDHKPVYYLLNKVVGEFDRADVLKISETQSLALSKERIYLFPRVAGGVPAKLSGEPVVQAFLKTFGEDLVPEKTRAIYMEQQTARMALSRQKLVQLAHLLETEEEASRLWLERLKQLSLQAVDALLKGEEDRFKANSNQYIRMEIRRLFARYDLLGKPRRLVQGIILTPLRFLTGRKARKNENRREDLARLRKNADPTALISALEQFNRLVLEKLSPADPALPLGAALRQPDLALTEQDVEDRMVKQREALLHWIEVRFKDLADGLSQKTKWGIYTASILWGVLLIAVASALGGGFSMLDMALDSALAPFITKGATELLAYQEISKITHELATRHKDGLASIIEEQSLRYRQCLMALQTPPDALAAILDRAKEGFEAFTA
ncbi:MAG TPA: hypothetical protein HPP58_00020 [Deltaproteobacteria bacterium]|nr:hypothetical protein [Deltaproteobacteria bacterium]HIJ39450.1 hypothetical protein [Deltaproteobacteria bacterium]